MRNPFSSRRFVTAAGSLAAIVAIAAIAQAATDTIYKYTTPKTGVWHVSAPAMAPEASGTAYQSTFPDGAIQLTAGQGCFNSTPHLPNGAVITSVASIWDAPGLNGTAFGLLRYPVSGSGLAQSVGQRFVPDTNGRKVIQAPLEAQNVVVNNNRFLYLVTACLRTTTDQFYGVRIGYTYTHAGD